MCQDLLGLAIMIAIFDSAAQPSWYLPSGSLELRCLSLFCLICAIEVCDVTLPFMQPKAIAGIAGYCRSQAAPKSTQGTDELL